MPCTGECKRPAPPRGSSPVSDDGDVWGSDEESIATHADLKRTHMNQGYLDGVTQAQEQGLQQGFDRAYPEGAELGRRVGRILAYFHDSPHREQAVAELNITKVLSKQYFDDSLETLSHLLVDKWESRVTRA